MPAVFLSYSHKDKRAANRVMAALADRQIPCLRDIETLRGGDRWVERLGEAISSASAVILLWSKSASSSEQVRHEWTTALSLNKRVIIARVDNEPLPAALKAIHAVDARDFESILRGLAGSPEPAPHSAVPGRRWGAPLAGLALLFAVGLWIALAPGGAPAPAKNGLDTTSNEEPATVPPIDAPAALESRPKPPKTVHVSTLSGFVQDERGDPLSGVRITLPEENQDCRTNERGRFQFTLTGRTGNLVRLIATKDCYETWTADAPVGDARYGFVMRKGTCISGNSSPR